jgi:hypothetical protein
MFYSILLFILFILLVALLWRGFQRKQSLFIYCLFWGVYCLFIPYLFKVLKKYTSVLKKRFICPFNFFSLFSCTFELLPYICPRNL